MRRAAVFAVALLLIPNAEACSWAVGYFHQVSSLRGQVVGKDLRPINFRWLRQSFVASKAELTLYEYRHPYELDRSREVRSVKADDKGRFEFGAVPAGHYILQIKTTELEDYFDVEITHKVRETVSVLIDISPVTPDCKGGHEFNVTSKG